MRQLITLLASILLIAGPGFAADDAEARKTRTITQLEAENVPYIDWLPPVASEAEARRRTKKEVVERMIGAMITAVKAETNDDALIEKVIQQYRAETFFTPEERAFLNDPNPSDADRAKFGWRYEGVYVLFWALGFEEYLPRPNRIVDVGLIAGTMAVLGADGLNSEATLRPTAEILDALDLAYRYHWAVVDARINGKTAPAGLDGGVVYERHRALNWLTGYRGQSWDDVSTDT